MQMEQTEGPQDFEQTASYEGDASQQAYYDGPGAGGDFSGALVGSYGGEDFSSLPTAILNAAPKQRLTDEEKLARDCMRRRQTDLERRARIFDAKRRMIGVDKEALDAQVAEKQAMKAQQGRDNGQADMDMKNIDKALKLIEVEKQRKRREHETHCKEYSLQNLHFQARREYDLNDPLAKRKGEPARTSDYDARCGASSLQKFSGEDLMKDERVRQQRAAMVSSIEQQKFEKAMLKQQEDDPGIFGNQVEQITALRNEIEENEVALRKELQRKQYEEIISQANANQERRRAIMMENVTSNEKELNFHASDKFLNEQAPSHFNNRVIRDAFKGSSREERIKVAAEQQQQREERQYAKAYHKQADATEAFMMDATRKQLVAMERDKQRLKRQMREQMAQDNLKLQEEQRSNLKHLNKVYNNGFAPEFFEQFGNGCR